MHIKNKLSIRKITLLTKILFGSLLFFLMATPSHATCWAPNCFGAVGFDPNTGQTSYATDYPTEYQVKEVLQKDCPSCTYLTFNNACGAIVFSEKHNFSLRFYGSYERDLTAHALGECRTKINEIGLNESRNDRRRSRVRSGVESDCKIAVLACTYRMY
ncbi:DUF4189 domain-containing protein [Paenalcaligenes sp. Me52]|uniref:DUF4189 domain-containing protein n=1 Tax=Paenalcaligenes sp. Me52 TaxID=3392038 RepID=UPI003D2799EF